jgi:hypothetical protein
MIFSIQVNIAIAHNVDGNMHTLDKIITACARNPINTAATAMKGRYRGMDGRPGFAYCGLGGRMPVYCADASFQLPPSFTAT